MPTYRVRNWAKHFENNRTKELKRMAWVPMPVNHDGDGYTELLDHQDGAAHFGAWCACVEVAAKCDPRGTFLRDGGKPHDYDTLARITRIKRSVFEAAFPRLISIGWIEAIPLTEQALTEIPQEGATIPHEAAALRAGARGNGTERNGTEVNDSDGMESVVAIVNDGENSFDLPGMNTEERAEHSRKTFAKAWIDKHRPSLSRAGTAPFARLIARLGKDQAVQQVGAIMNDPSIGNPFAYLESKLDNLRAQSDSRESSEARAKRIMNGSKRL